MLRRRTSYKRRPLARKIRSRARRTHRVKTRRLVRRPRRFVRSARGRSSRASRVLKYTRLAGVNSIARYRAGARYKRIARPGRKFVDKVAQITSQRAIIRSGGNINLVTPTLGYHNHVSMPLNVYASLKYLRDTINANNEGKQPLHDNIKDCKYVQEYSTLDMELKNFSSVDAEVIVWELTPRHRRYSNQPSVQTLLVDTGGSLMSMGEAPNDNSIFYSVAFNKNLSNEFRIAKKRTIHILGGCTAHFNLHCGKRSFSGRLFDPVLNPVDLVDIPGFTKYLLFQQTGGLGKATDANNATTEIALCSGIYKTTQCGYLLGHNRPIYTIEDPSLQHAGVTTAMVAQTGGIV